MKKLIGLLAVLVMQNAFAASPVGSWKTIDDETGEAKSIVSISESKNHHLYGKVVKLFKDPGRLCTACEGANHNKPIVGLTVVYDLKPSDGESNLWEDGEILDPKTGKIYHCSARLTDNGSKLQVRGYIGIALFGRSQTWLRVE